MIRLIRGNPSARLPDSIYGRRLAGESVTEIWGDYAIFTSDAVEWAIELAALRIMAESRPRTKRHQP